MRRGIVYGLAVIAAAVVALAYWFANRTVIVGRATIGVSPPRNERPRSRTGEPAPLFNALDESGREVGTASARGRVIVVSVWAPWCRPCVDELPRVEREIWQRFKPQVDVLGLALGETAPKVRDYNRAAGLTFPLVPDPDAKIARLFGAEHSIPQTFVIDHSGRIVYHAIGYGPRDFDLLVSAVQRATR